MVTESRHSSLVATCWMVLNKVAGKLLRARRRDIGIAVSCHHLMRSAHAHAAFAAQKRGSSSDQARSLRLHSEQQSSVI